MKRVITFIIIIMLIAACNKNGIVNNYHLLKNSTKYKLYGDWRISVFVIDSSKVVCNICPVVKIDSLGVLNISNGRLDENYNWLFSNSDSLIISKKDTGKSILLETDSYISKFYVKKKYEELILENSDGRYAYILRRGK